MKDTDLDRLEGKVYREYNRDGALEFLIGIGFVLAGAFVLGSRHGSFVGLVPIFIVLLSRAWKKRITYPRLGYAEFTAARQAGKKRLLVLVLLTIAAVIILGVIGHLAAKATFADKDLMDLPHANLVLGGLLVLFVLAIAVFRKASALYPVVVVFLVLVVLSDQGYLRLNEAILWTGLLSLLIGTVKLIRFVHAHPRMDGDAARE